jgi:plastocyanin
MVRRTVSPGYRRAVALGIGVILLTMLWGASAASSPAPASARAHIDASGQAVEWLNVTVSNALQFTVSTNQVTPGDLVHVVVTQTGDIPHTFTLSPTAGYEFPVTDASSDLTTYFSNHPPLVNVQVTGTLPGEVFYGNFTAPAYGEYEYVCTEPGHFPSMSGLLGSGEAGGATATDNGPGAAVFIIVGVITSLVIICLVLGFVVGKRRGSEDEMPPERLGYPEGPRPAAPPGPPPTAPAHPPPPPSAPPPPLP